MEVMISDDEELAPPISEKGRATLAVATDQAMDERDEEQRHNDGHSFQQLTTHDYTAYIHRAGASFRRLVQQEQPLLDLPPPNSGVYTHLQCTEMLVGPR